MKRRRITSSVHMANSLLLIAVCLLAIGVSDILAESGDDVTRFRFVQISDTQPPLDQPGQWDKIAKLVETVNSLEPAFVLFPGDITHSGTDEESERIKQQLSSIKAPVHYVPGNHDTIWPANPSEEAMSAAELREKRLPGVRQYFGPERWSFEHGDFQFVGFDSTDNWPDLTGELKQWLVKTFDASEKPYKFVVTHYDHGWAKNQALDHILTSVGAVGYMHGHNHAVQAYRNEGSGRLAFSSGTGTSGAMYFDVCDDSLSCFWKPLDGEVETLGEFNLAEVKSAVARRGDIFHIAPYIQELQPDGVTVKWYTRVVPEAAIAFRNNEEGEWAKKSLAANRNHMVLREVKLDQLVPSKKHEYYVEVTTEEFGLVTSPIVSFETPAETALNSTRFALYGDTRSFPNDHRKIASAIAEECANGLDFCLHTGDLTVDGRVLEGWAREFFGPAEDLMARVLMYAVLGNHEASSNYFFDFFDLPGNERWYSFDRGPVHVICLDSCSPSEPDSDQYKWLVDDLANCDSVWKVLVCHSPFFTSGPHGGLNANGKPREKPIANQQDYILPLLEEHDITMVFGGHDHLYERSKKGDIYFIVTGGGGAPLYGTTQNIEQNPYSEVAISVHHYCIVDASLNEFNLTVHNSAGDIIDKVDISKTSPVNAGQDIAK